ERDVGEALLPFPGPHVDRDHEADDSGERVHAGPGFKYRARARWSTMGPRPGAAGPPDQRTYRRDQDRARRTRAARAARATMAAAPAAAQPLEGRGRRRGRRRVAGERLGERGLAGALPGAQLEGA